MTLRALTGVLLCLLVVTPAIGETGVGNLPPQIGVPRGPSMSGLGADAFRFTANQWRRLNWVLELHQDDDLHASGAIAFYGRSDNGGLKKFGWLSLSLSGAEYDQLMGKIDAALSRGDQTPVATGPGELVVCIDGEIYASERRKSGQTTWITSPRCGFEDPNDDVRDAAGGVSEAVRMRVPPGLGGLRADALASQSPLRQPILSLEFRTVSPQFPFFGSPSEVEPPGCDWGHSSLSANCSKPAVPDFGVGGKPDIRLRPICRQDGRPRRIKHGEVCEC
jgi:hypothetical protein